MFLDDELETADVSAHAHRSSSTRLHQHRLETARTTSETAQNALCAVYQTDEHVADDARFSFIASNTRPIAVHADGKPDSTVR